MAFEDVGTSAISRREATAADRGVLLNSTIEKVLRILDGMGHADASESSVITAPSFYDAPVLMKQTRGFSQFSLQVAVTLRFVGYPFEDVAFLTVREFCEMYVNDSFPSVPSVPLTEGQYGLSFHRSNSAQGGGKKDFPICFVLGSPRSGTTLLRAMLDMHTGLWAPGELHLANFGTMAERAEHLKPVLRYMPIPEVASRCSESVATFAARFRSWELAAMPITDVFQHLHDADPSVMIVDKSPPYCAQLETLEQIGKNFPNAKFLHIVRSPHDVIRSYVRMQLHRGNRDLFEPGRNPYQMGEAIWFACNANSQAFLATLPANRQCAIRYEDLTSAPAESLRPICTLLEQEFQPHMADPYAKPGATALGAGDLHINLLGAVERREPIDAFYAHGSRCMELASQYGY